MSHCHVISWTYFTMYYQGQINPPPPATTSTRVSRWLQEVVDLSVLDSTYLGNSFKVKGLIQQSDHSFYQTAGLFDSTGWVLTNQTQYFQGNRIEVNLETFYILRFFLFLLLFFGQWFISLFPRVSQEELFPLVRFDPSPPFSACVIYGSLFIDLPSSLGVRISDWNGSYAELRLRWHILRDNHMALWFCAKSFFSRRLLGRYIRANNSIKVLFEYSV